MNNITLVGRLTKAPELSTHGETTITRFRLAVDGSRKTDPADFIPITCFGKLAEACAEYLTQGQQVALAGRLNHNVWVTPEGDNRERYEVIARDVTFGSKPKTSTDATPTPEHANAEEPF